MFSIGKEEFDKYRTSKCHHYSWEYCGERVYQHNEKDSKNRWGQVHDIIRCKDCGVYENHVNWKRHFEEYNKFFDMLSDIKQKLNGGK